MRNPRKGGRFCRELREAGVETEGRRASVDPERNALVLAGEWDFAAKNELRQLTDRLGDRDATIDLEHVTFIDSSVINEIVHTYNRLRATDHRLRLVTSGGHIARLLNVTGLDRVIEIEQRTPP
jgi:anti-anti-sigma factor